MDSALLTSYRLLWDDILMIYDTACIYFERRVNERNIHEFVEGLSVIRNRDELLPEKLHEIEYDEDEKVFGEAEVARKILWEFSHVLLEFICEELSQFPFWAAKVSVICASRSSPSFIREFWSQIFRSTMQRGLGALFEANIPYTTAAFVIQFKYLEKQVRNYLSVMNTRIQSIPSSTSNLTSKLKKTKNNELSAYLNGSTPSAKVKSFSEDDDAAPPTIVQASYFGKRLTFYVLKEFTQSFKIAL